MPSKLILGTAQFGMDYGINNATGKIQKSEVFEILNYAFQNEIQFLDTAPVYGDAHKIIGEFHNEHSEIRFKVITKIPANYPIEKLEELVDNFLFEMNIDCIEVLHFHSIKDYLSSDDHTITRIFNNLKLSRKVKSFGVSIYDNSEAELLSRGLIDVVQLPFNLLDNVNLRGDVIQKLKRKNFEIHSRSVFLQGLFFKKAEDVKSVELKESLVKLKEISKTYNCEIAELALNYCIYQKNVDNLLIGVDSLEHLKKNISYITDPMDKDFIRFINDIVISDTTQLNPSKWGKG